MTKAEIIKELQRYGVEATKRARKLVLFTLLDEKKKNDTEAAETAEAAKEAAKAVMVAEESAKVAMQIAAEATASAETATAAAKTATEAAKEAARKVKSSKYCIGEITGIALCAYLSATIVYLLYVSL